MSSEKNRKKISLLAIAGFLALLLVSLTFLNYRSAIIKSSEASENFSDFPVEIKGYYLIEKVHGEKAIKILSEMHKAELELKNAYFLRYINEAGGEIAVYIAVAESKNKAEELFERMTERIKNSNIEIEEIEVGGKKAYFLPGFGFESNIYYLSENRVIWVSANENIESPAIREIVENL